jgi:hypothetical protein
MILQVMLWEIISRDRGHWGSLAGSNVLLCRHRPSRLVSKVWAPRTTESHLIYPCMQVTEAKSKAQPTYGCLWLHWLFHFPSATWPSCFSSLSFISLLCHPFPPSCYQNTVCLFLSCPPSPFLLQTEKCWGEGNFRQSNSRAQVKTRPASGMILFCLSSDSTSHSLGVCDCSWLLGVVRGCCFSRRSKDLHLVGL